jgi:hypothetical protein
MRALAFRNAREGDLPAVEGLAAQRLAPGSEVWCENPGCRTTYTIFFDVSESSAQAYADAQAEHVAFLRAVILREHAHGHPTEIAYHGNGVTPLAGPPVAKKR